MTMKFRLAHWNQLISYIQDAERVGWYYGDKRQFDNRHKDLHEWAKQQAQQANKNTTKGKP